MNKRCVALSDEQYRESVDLLRNRFKKALAGKDAEKLSYIRDVMKQPLVDSETMDINLEKLKVMTALGIIDSSVI